DDTLHGREGNDLDLEIDTGDFLRRRQLDPRGVARARNARVIGWRVAARFGCLLHAAEIPHDLSHGLLEAAGRRAHEIVARWEAEHSILSAIVGLVGARGRELFLTPH